MTEKRYDRAYFDTWYRGPDPPVGTEADLQRAVALAVAAAESVMARPLGSVLDVGCGEGRWQPVVRRLRADAVYLGIDPSEYAVERYGESRNLRRGRFGELAHHVFDEPFDLVVCSDVLHYLDDEEILEGIDPLAERTGGVAVLDIFTKEDDPEGDRVDFRLRPAAWYRSVLSEAGLVPIGLQMYVPVEVAQVLETLDLPGTR
jgi:SAM-dependent methyltransferase